MRTVKINRWMEGETNVYGGSNFKKVHMEHTLGNLLFSMLGEKGNLFMAQWTCFMITIMLCKLKVPFQFLTKQVCSHFYGLQNPPIATVSMSSLCLEKVPVARVAHMPYRGVVMGTEEEKEIKILYRLISRTCDCRLSSIFREIE